MRRSKPAAKAAFVIAILLATALGLLTIGMASADDPVTVKLTPWAEGDVTVVNIAITNNTDEILKLDISAYLPAGATFVGGQPAYKLTGGTVYWNQPNAASKKTLVGYQFKYRGGGAASVSVAYTGKSKGTVSATTAAAAAPAAPAAQAPLAAAKAPVGKLTIVPVPANAANQYAIKATLPGTTSTVAMGTTGLPNVSVGVPVLLKGESTVADGPASKYTWTLAKPNASKAALDKTDGQMTKFTPDVPGTYKVDVVVANNVGSAPMRSVQIRAGTYIGVQAGNCKNCHAAEVTEWAETGHGEIFQEEMAGGADPATSHYGQGCVRCHTTGYYLGAKNGGFADLQAQAGWNFPALSVIQTGKAYEALPATLKQMGNIQCEACHGPAADHVNKKAPMAASLDEGVCNICHNGGGHHIKGTQTQYAGHDDASAGAWNEGGPNHQACARCHSGEGYISFVKNPTEMASWTSADGPLMCAACHDPHSAANPFQLRVVGKPLEVMGVTKDFGLSATCATCHWSRNTGADAAKSAATPHHSQAAEMMANTGGVDYGKTLANSPHGDIVGAAPMKNAAGEDLYGGNKPGPCVACHMYPTGTGALQNKVGEHSWNVVSPDGTPYTGSCAACHGALKDFNIAARADFDGNGKIEGVKAEVSGMLKLVNAAIGASGIAPLTARPYFDQANKPNWTNSQKNAIYNFLFVRGDNDGASNAIHNFKRSISLLQASYKDLTGKDVPNATIMK